MRKVWEDDQIKCDLPVEFLAGQSFKQPEVHISGSDTHLNSRKNMK